jgi:hypothetical protein
VIKHKHSEFIKLMADGMRIECRVVHGTHWRDTCWDDFGFHGYEFRVAPNQPADAEGWISWHGGENPAVGKRVDVKYKGQDCLVNLFSVGFDWRHKGSDSDITHYRIVKEKAKKWRWMFFYPAKNQPSSIYISEPFTEDEAAKYFDGVVRLRVAPEWKMEVCDE